MSYGSLFFYGGIALAGVSGISLVIGNIIYAVKRKNLRERLYALYGFWRKVRPGAGKAPVRNEL